jgi:hypothetical protein
MRLMGAWFVHPCHSLIQELVWRHHARGLRLRMRAYQDRLFDPRWSPEDHVLVLAAGIRDDEDVQFSKGRYDWDWVGPRGS